MKASNIGGQAVMEGVMMKSKDRYAIAVRKTNQEIVLDVQDVGTNNKIKKLREIPLIRGVFSFVDSLVIGTKALMYSASFFEEEETDEQMHKSDDKPNEKDGEAGFFERIFKEKAESIMLGFTVCFSVIISIVIFFGLPLLITEILRKYVTNNEITIAISEGVIRVGIFILYIVGISFMKDIQRFFMYHGAEHKCINCIETGMNLTVENVKKSSKQHKRCGTSFMLFVMIISIIFFLFIRFSNPWLRLLSRLLLIPVIAGVSYEFIRLAGRTENPVVNLLSKPGLWLQRLTTREPDEDMIEVAIVSVEAVFDWKAFLKENG